MKESAKKSEAYQQQIRSQQRQQLFREQRRKLEEARRLDDQIQIQLAQKYLMEVFENNTEEYRRLMEMAEQLDEEERKYQEYLQKLEEQSANFEKLEMQRKIVELKKELELYFVEEQ